MHEISFEGLFGDGAVFGSIGEGDSRPVSKVASVDGCKPRGLDGKSCCSVEVSDKGTDAGKVTGIQGGGKGAPLSRNRWMSLVEDIKTIDFGAGEFAPSAKDDHVVLG